MNNVVGLLLGKLAIESIILIGFLVIVFQMIKIWANR